MFLVDGFRTTILLAGAPGPVWLRERELTPPSLEGGGPIETTTMRNNTMRSFAPKSLISLGEMNGMAQYDPFVYSQLLPLINVVQSLIITFPDAATLQFYGWVDFFKPQTAKEGEFPGAEFRIIPGNINPSGAGATEVQPVAVAGTGPGLLLR